MAAIRAQELQVEPNQPEFKFFETGLTALLRVIDTVRLTLDPSAKSQDRKVHLLGEPILVLRARLLLEGTDKTSPIKSTLPPVVQGVPVRIGDLTRPDDGVLGCFISGSTPAESRFVPVSEEAKRDAVLNRLARFVSDPFNKVKVEHGFIRVEQASFSSRWASNVTL